MNRCEKGLRSEENTENNTRLDTLHLKILNDSRTRQYNATRCELVTNSRKINTKPGLRSEENTENNTCLDTQ
jgi:hypothetical protein